MALGAGRMLMVTIALALAGCGGAGGLEGGGGGCPIPNATGCAQPRGVYETQSVERAGGTCGPKAIVRGEVPFERVTRFQAPCSGDVEWSDDFCTASFEASCPEEERGSGFYNEQVSHTVYSADGLTRTGVFELSVYEPDGTLYCASTYDSQTRNVSCE